MSRKTDGPDSVPLPTGRFASSRPATGHEFLHGNAEDNRIRRYIKAGIIPDPSNSLHLLNYNQIEMGLWAQLKEEEALYKHDAEPQFESRFRDIRGDLGKPK
jgi:hypothetical protein